MSTFGKFIDRIWAAQNQSQQAEEAVQQKQHQITAPKPQKAPATKPVQTAQSTDTRTTAQKAADSKAAYTAYQGSEEQKKNRGEANKKALQEVMDRLFAVPNTSMGEMPLSVAAPVPVDQKEQALKAEADYYEGQLKMEQDKAMMDADLAEYESWSAQDKANMEQYLEERNRHQNNIFGEPQFDTYNLNPLFQTKDPAKVRQMAESIQRSRNAQAMEQATAAADQLAQEHPVLGSAASVATNLASSYTGPVEIAKEMANRTGRYQTMDPNNLGGIGQQFGGTVRQNVSQQIEGENGNWLRKLAAVGYEGVMSAADSTARMAAGGFNPGVSAAIAASGGFSNSLRQYSAQGATPEQAAAAALATAGIEYITEKIPMDELLKVGKGGWKNVLKQAFLTEPTTEEISLFAGVAAETLILGKNSDRSQKIGELVANGMSYQEATEQLDKQLWMEAARTYGVSAVAGGISGAGAKNVYDIQAAMDELGAELAKNMPAEQPVQLTEGQRAMQQAADALLGIAQEAQKNTASDEEAVVVKSAGTALTEENKAKNTLAYTLASNIDNVKDMASVAQLSGREFNDRGVKLSDQIRNFFRSLGNKVSRTGFGDVELGEYGVGGMLNHRPLNRAKVLSLASVPEVIKNGRQISYDPNWKGRGYESYTFAAPVTVAGQDVYVAAIVNRFPDNKFYLSEMVDSNGNYVRIEESPSGNSKNGLPMGPENQQGRSYAGPEELSKEGDPSANAEPMPLSNNIVTESGAEVKGTGAAEQNFSGKAEYQDLLYEGNVQPDRAGDVRPMEVPKTDTAGNPVSEVAANAYGSQHTPDDLASETESAIARGELSYIEISNDTAAERATQKIEAVGGWREAYTQWHDEVRDGKTSAEMAARGALLLNHAAEVYEQTKATGDEAATKAAKQEWVSILMDVRAMGTNTAQGLQAMRLIRDLAPPDKLDFAVASIKRMVADMKLQEEVEIDEKLLNEYRMAETDEQRDEIMTEIQQNVADQIPSTFLDKWTALRYMNMLGNLKTNVRNVAGNVGSMVLYRVKDQVAAAVEKMAGTDRTKSNFVSRELLQACKEDFNQVKTAINSGGKYNERMAAADEFRQGVMDKRRIYNNSIAEGYRKATNWMMNNEYFGDEAFGRAAYSRALAGYLKAKGYDAAAMQNGSIEDSVMDAARAYAIREAQEATFHDNSKLAEVATRVQRSTGVVGQGIMPFTKTPANVLTRAVEFSPLGLIDTAIKQAQRAAGNTGLADKTGAAGAWARAGQDITGADVVNSLSKSLTGSALVALGWLMKDQGFLSGGPDDDEKKEKFDDLNGAQNYAITLPNGTSYTIDWLTPAAMPLFMGAQIADVVNKDGDFTFSDLFDVFTSIADPMVQMSMLQGLNDTLDGIKYTDNNLGQFFINSAVSYLTQGLTNTLLGQIERSTEENRQTTYIDKDSWVPTQIQQALGKASQKIPIWDYQQMDYRNAWGETEKNEGGLLYNLLSPGYLSQEKQTAVSEEIYQIREKTGENVFPKAVEKTVDYTTTSGEKRNGYNLSMEEYEAMQTTTGKTAAKLLDQLIASPDYKSLSDEQKAYAIKAVYEYAAEKGKQEALPDYFSKADTWVKNARDNDIGAFISQGTIGPLKTAVNNVVEDLSNGWKVTPAAKQEMNETYDGYSKLSPEAKQRLQEQLDGDVKKFLEVRQAGVSTDGYLKAVAGIKSLEPEGEYTTIRDVQKWEAAEKAGTATAAKDALVKAYMDDYNPDSKSPDKTELKYDYLREKLNRTPAEAIAIMRAKQDGGGKDAVTARWSGLGYSPAECKILWNLLGTTGSKAIDVVSWHNSKTK